MENAVGAGWQMISYLKKSCPWHYLICFESTASWVHMIFIVDCTIGICNEWEEAKTNKCQFLNFASFPCQRKQLHMLAAQGFSVLRSASNALQGLGPQGIWKIALPYRYLPDLFGHQGRAFSVSRLVWTGEGTFSLAALQLCNSFPAEVRQAPTLHCKACSL